MTTLLLIRHALTDSVKNQMVAGRLPDIHLNEEGQSQAEKLGAAIAVLKIRAIYSSPLERAIETAQTIAQRSDLKVETDDAFGELQFGDWTGKTFQELESEERWRNFNSFRSGTRIPNGELMLEAQTRIITGLESLREKHSGETVAVVSHSDLIKVAVAHYAGIHIDLFQRVEIGPASISVIKVGDDAARIITVNHRSELIDYQNSMNG